MKKILKNNKYIYILITLVAAILLIYFKILDIKYSSIVSIYSIFIRVIFILLCSIYLTRIKAKQSKFKLNKYLLYSLIPSLFVLILNIGNFNIKPELTIILDTFLTMFTTVIFEEFYFRGVGIEIFREENTFNLKSLIVLSALYAIFYLSNIFFIENMMITLLDVLLHFSISILFINIYIKSKNIATIILGNFMMSIIKIIFDLYVSSSIINSNILLIIAYIISSIIISGVGIYIFKKDYGEIEWRLLK